jgi:hypothetical protein
MSVTAVATPSAAWEARFLGRPFIHLWFDYLIIGGGLSLVLTLALNASGGAWGERVLGGGLPIFLFLSNLAHFAASTVRLYTRPHAFRTYRFLTRGLPLVSVIVLSLAIWQPGGLGTHLQALLLTWSPFHYAAQAYGLSLMYCYRSGCTLDDASRRILRVTCLAPFLFSFMTGSGAGLEWFVRPIALMAHPGLLAAREATSLTLGLATFLLPVALFVRLLAQGKAMPLISVLIVLANGVWWITLWYMQAFVWATIFHGLQYLAITLIFHVRERLQSPGNARPWWFHVLTFYALCLLLGYGLFQLLPLAYLAAGFGWAESVLLVIAAINIHHFIVDAYIWRLRSDPNYQVVTAAA